jgi:restriction system protein
MAVWLVRAGREGEREALALEQSIVLIGWSELPDLSPITTRDQLDALCRRTYPDRNPKTVTNWVGQIWAFRRRIQVGDLVVLPLKARPFFAIGRATADYQYRADLPQDARHTRPVEWLRTDLPRAAMPQDLRYSLGAFMTVCQIKRNDAEPRINALLDWQPSDGVPAAVEDAAGEPVDTAQPLNLGEIAADQIREHIGLRFRQHELTRLINALLQAQGYRTEQAAPGPDAGVDIIAGRGPLGFDQPRLCVQVKSSEQPQDVRVVRELQGVLPNFRADQGLLVSWGGFTTAALREARPLFFQIRLWTANDVVGAVLEHYDRLPEDLRAEIPLQRIWTLVPEE